MKMICTQENFKKAIYNTERVIGKQSTLPILENILLETERGMMKFSATNLEIGVFLKIGAKIEKEGKITVPAKLLGNFINNLPPGDNIQIEANDQILKIKSGGYKATIKGLGAQDFPIIPEISDDFLFSFNSDDLKEVVPKLLACVSLDGARPELGGINVFFGENKVDMAATDSFRLLEIEIGINKENNERFGTFVLKTNSIIIPASTLAEVFRVISPETKEIKVAIEENQIFFQIDNVRIVSRLVNGKYPEYKQIIPRDFTTKTIIEKEDFLRAVKIASLFTNSKSGEINLKLDSKEGKISVSAESEEKGENKTEIKAGIEGENQEIILNPRYVIDGINSVSNERLALLANSGSSPVVIRLVQEKEEEMKIINKLTYVVMPIKN